MRVEAFKLRDCLEQVDKPGRAQFWKELEGVGLSHVVRGSGVITKVENTSIHVDHADGSRVYSARLMHQYIDGAIEIPDDGAVAAQLRFEEQLEELYREYAEWQIDWRGLHASAAEIKLLIGSWRQNQEFAPADIIAARNIGVGHIVPVGFELAGQNDPWNYVRASAAWRALGLPSQAIECIQHMLGPTLRLSGRRDPALEQAGLTTLLAAFVDFGDLNGGGEYALKLKAMQPTRQSCLALFRFYREVGDILNTDVWLKKAIELGVDESALHGRAGPRNYDWLKNWSGLRTSS